MVFLVNLLMQCKKESIIIAYLIIKVSLKIKSLSIPSNHFKVPDIIITFVQRILVMELFIITIVLLALAFGGIAIKIWAKKDGKFAGTCASQSPVLNKEGVACGFCGKMPDEMKDCSETNKED